MTLDLSRKEKTHARIVAVAARNIRRFGLDAMSIVDVMREAGLSHGGFYAHFKSRDDLLAQALAHAAREGDLLVAERAAAGRAAGSSPLQALVESYLLDCHLDSAQDSCAIVALSYEIPRRSEDIKAIVSESFQAMLTRVRSTLGKSAPPGAAEAIASQIVGAIQIARALRQGPERASVLSACVEDVIGRHGR